MARVTTGVVMSIQDDAVEKLSKRAGHEYLVSEDFSFPFDRALILRSKTVIQWPMVDAGMHLLGVWDAAAPLLLGKDVRHTLLARDVPASQEELKRTERIVHDMRMPVYGSEMIFVGRTEIGRELIEALRSELAHGENHRLAFLRAFYQVKPRLCALPSIWTGTSRHAAKATRVQTSTNGPRVSRKRANRHPASAPNDLVAVEIKPGVYVRCRRGEEAKYIEKYGGRVRSGRQRGSR